MVKIVNEFGDVLKGKTGEAIYQGHYGRQIRRKSYKKNDNPSSKQIQVRKRFKDSIIWVNSLTFSQKQNIKHLFKNQFPSYEKGQPTTWFNYAKWLYLSNPKFSIIDSSNNCYKINHPAIMNIEEYDSSMNLIYSSQNLSDLSDLSLYSSFIHTPSPEVSSIQVTTLTGLLFVFTLPALAPVNPFPNWLYKNYIDITGSIDGVLSEYPIQITVPYQEFMKDDLSDVIFVDSSDNSQLSYNKISYTSKSSATFDVYFPSIPANPSNFLLNLYAGNPDAIDHSSPEDVYIFYDNGLTDRSSDYSPSAGHIIYNESSRSYCQSVGGGVLISINDVVADNYQYDIYLYNGSGTSIRELGIRGSMSGGNNYISTSGHREFSTARRWIYYSYVLDGVNTSFPTDTATIPASVWFKVSIQKIGTTYNVTWYNANGTVLRTHSFTLSSPLPAGGFGIYFYSPATGYGACYFRYVKISPATLNPPTLGSLGTWVSNSD